MRDFHAIANEDYPLENLPNGTLHVDKNMKCFPLPTINPTGGGMSIPQPDNRFPPHDHYFMFVHGYNVSADDARKVNDDLYKNLSWVSDFAGTTWGSSGKVTCGMSPLITFPCSAQTC